MTEKTQNKNKCERIMDALNTMKPIRNKKVRNEFAKIYSTIFDICEGH